MSQALQPRPRNAEIPDRPARPLAGRPDSGADLPLVREVDVAPAARAMRCLSWPLDSSKCLCEAPGTFERRCLKKQAPLRPKRLCEAISSLFWRFSCVSGRWRLLLDSGTHAAPLPARFSQLGRSCLGVWLFPASQAATFYSLKLPMRSSKGSASGSCHIRWHHRITRKELRAPFLQRRSLSFTCLQERAIYSWPGEPHFSADRFTQPSLQPQTLTVSSTSAVPCAVPPRRR